MHCLVFVLLFTRNLFVQSVCNARIQGYTFKNGEIKVLAYADDIAVFCTDEESAQEVVKIAKEHSHG